MNEQTPHLVEKAQHTCLTNEGSPTCSGCRAERERCRDLLPQGWPRPGIDLRYPPEGQSR